MAKIRLLMGAAGPYEWRSGKVLEVAETSGFHTIAEEEAKRYVSAGFAEPIQEAKGAEKSAGTPKRTQRRKATKK